MDQKQFDAMLSDAETRLRRLKMLYEQWFLGFERTEPAVLRKEFEDLLALLRKEQGGNTALRFRLQQLVQRHTTFTTHWRRVGRQIEEGTYQRDVLRARRMKSRNGEERDYAGPELELSYDVDLDDELEDALEEVRRAAEMAAGPPPSAALPIAAVAQTAALPSAPPRGVATPPLAAAQAAPAKPGVPMPPPPVAVKPHVAKLPAVPPPPSAAAGASAARPPLGAWTSLRAPTNAAARVATAQPSATPNPDASPLTAAAAFGAALPRGGIAGPRSISPFAMPGAGKPAAQPLAAAANGASSGNAHAHAGVARPVPSAKPAGPVPAAAKPAAVAPRAPVAKPAAAAISGNGTSATGGAFSTDDMQRIYTQYLSARKQNAERVDNVKLDSVEKTIRGMLPQLEKKHVGKKIDFEVVVKDGKVALKPIAR